MKMVYECADCDTKYVLEDLRVIKGTFSIFLQCTNDECEGDNFCIKIE